jgi:hypothetical protein
VVLDNLREGVLSPDIYDPGLNPAVSRCSGALRRDALPCRVRDPDRKGKVESGVGHAQKTPLKGKRFESLEEAQAYLDHWEERWADTRIHGTTKRQVAAMFAEEKPTLQPLPLEPFRYYQYGERTVHLDGCVEVEAAYYGAPPGWIGRQVQVQWDAMFVRLLDPRTGQLLREHLRQKRGATASAMRTVRAYAAATLQLLLARAHKAEPHRRCLRRHPCSPGRTRSAPHPGRSLNWSRIRQRGGRRCLRRRWNWASPSTASCAAIWSAARKAPLSLRQVDPLIRELVQYRDLIQQRITTSRNPRMNLIELNRALDNCA